MVTVDLYATEFTVEKDDDTLLGRFEADATGVRFTRDGDSEPMTPEHFEVEFGNEFQVSRDADPVSIATPEKYAKALPDRWNNGYIYAVLVPTKA